MAAKNEENEKLENCYLNSLKLAIDNDCKTIAFPNISTGIYHFPKEKVAQIAYKTTLAFLEKFHSIEIVYFVCFDEENYKILLAIAEKDK